MLRQVVIACVGFFAITQPLAAQNLKGFFAGVQTTTARYRIQDARQSTGSKIGVQAGANLKIPFDNQLYFAPHVNYSMKGYTVTLTTPSYPPGEDAVSNDVTFHTMEIAPLLHIDFSKNPSHAFIRFGPMIDVLFSGREKVGLKNGTTVERPMKFSFGDYGRLTSNAVAHLGYETARGFYIYGQTTYGLGSMNNADGGPQIRSTAYGLSIGFYFGHNPNVIDTRVKE